MLVGRLSVVLLIHCLSIVVSDATDHSDEYKDWSNLTAFHESLVALPTVVSQVNQLLLLSSNTVISLEDFTPQPTWKYVTHPFSLHICIRQTAAEMRKAFGTSLENTNQILQKMKRIPQHLKDFLKDIATKSSHSLLQSRIGFIVDATNECENLVIDSRRALANVTGLLIEIAHSLGAKKQYAKQNKFTFSGSRHHQRQSGNLKESYQGRSERTNIPFDGRSRAFTRAMTDIESRMSDIPDPWKGLVGCVINRTGDENDMLNMFQNKYILVSSAHLLTELSMLKNLTASDLSAEKIATLRIKFSDFFKTIHPSSSAPIRQKVLQVCNSSLKIIENWEKNINSSIETDKSLVWTTLNENLRELRLLSYGEINGSFMLDERLDECLGDLDRPTANVLNPARESHAPDDANERSKSHFYRLLSNSSSLMNSIEANWRKIEEFFKLLNDYQVINSENLKVFSAKLKELEFTPQSHLQSELREEIKNLSRQINAASFFILTITEAYRSVVEGYVKQNLDAAIYLSNDWNETETNEKEEEIKQQEINARSDVSGICDEEANEEYATKLGDHMKDFLQFMRDLQSNHNNSHNHHPTE